MPLILGVAVLVVALLWFVGRFSKPMIPSKTRGCCAASAVAWRCSLRRFFFSVARCGSPSRVGAFGLGLIGWMSPWPGFSWRSWKFPGRVSRVRSAFVEMELDHYSGVMRGRILAGHHDGASLDTLDVPTLVGLMSGIDDDSRSLMMAYLDRREPRWREYAKRNAGTGRAERRRGARQRNDGRGGLSDPWPCSPERAPSEIGRAHRSLMKKLHPDQGGSTYLAARVNQAKDVLLRRHR